MIQQYPQRFEYNEAFLLFVAEHCHSSRFGTFLFNTDRERKEAGVRERTVSLWTAALNAPFVDRFRNGSYEPTARPLWIRCNPRFIQVWQGLFFQVGTSLLRLRLAGGVWFSRTSISLSCSRRPALLCTADV